MKQMEANEVKPNHVTASILLKSLDKNSSDQEVAREGTGRRVM